MVRRREQMWRLVALVASLAAHLAFVAWLNWLPEPLREEGPVTGEFIFLKPTAPVPPPTPEHPEPPPARPPAPPSAPLRPSSQRPPPLEAIPVAPPSEPQAPAGAADVPSEPSSLDAPRLQPSLLPGSLSLLSSLDAGLQGSVATLRPELQGGSGLRALEPPKDLVGSLAKETLGRGRVERGLVHSYYSDLGRALLKLWDAERVAKSGLKGFTEQASENFKLSNELWADRASAYGRSGNPMGSDYQPSRNRRAAPNERLQGISGVDLEQRKELSRELREAFKATRRAVIRVVQDASGKLTRVELVQPSNDEKVDREALVDVRAAALKLPRPPSEAFQGTSLSSLWSFELVVSITPPIPTFTFEFDEALGFVDMRLPLDRRIYKRVRLVSVE